MNPCSFPKAIKLPVNVRVPTKIDTTIERFSIRPFRSPSVGNNATPIATNSDDIPPEPLKKAIDTAKLIIKKNYPLFGICLGHQVIALANGVSTYKMFNGHRGINHPIKNLITSKGEITSQNHGFAVVKEEAESHPDILITHIHLNDHTVAGMKMKSKNCFSVQYHPEAGPGLSLIHI